MAISAVPISGEPLPPPSIDERKCGKGGRGDVACRYRDPVVDTAARICKACYGGGRDLITDTCGECGRTKTAKPKAWYRDPVNADSRRCRECYQRAKACITETCSRCSKEKTARRWYTNPDNRNAQICQGCYQKVRRATRRASRGDAVAAAAPPSCSEREEEHPREQIHRDRDRLDGQSLSQDPRQSPPPFSFLFASPPPPV